ncbi:MAG: 30S ribosomal protein S4 [Candidatus Hodgkinia cicadicola]
MSKRKNSKFRFERRIGEELWNNPRSSVACCSNPPGQHGYKPKTKISDYCVKLLAKQRLKCYYSNITESKLRKTYKAALRYGGNVSHNLAKLLESRIDVLVYRVNLATSFIAARQLVNHGHIFVNNIRVNVCSYLCKPGDVFRVAPKSINLQLIKNVVLGSSLQTPSYLCADYKHLVFKLISLPKFHEIDYPSGMCFDLVMEYYQGLY